MARSAGSAMADLSPDEFASFVKKTEKAMGRDFVNQLVGAARVAAVLDR